MKALVRILLTISLIGIGGSGAVQAAGAVVGTGTAASCDDSALNAALSGGGTITFNCGSAPWTIILAGAKSIAVDTVIDGAGLITLSGGNASRLFVVNSGVTLTLQNVILTNGYIADDGGAISNFGTLIVSNSTIQKSTTDINHSGGAIMNFGTLTITNSVVANNSGGNGGAIFVWSGRATITNSSLHDNHTNRPDPDGWGGAVLLWDGASLRLEGSDLFNNQALKGGAVHNRFAASTIDIESDTRVHDNSATYGGGIYNLSGTATLFHATVQNNRATIAGGLYNESGITSVSQAMFAGNRATEGGAISTHGGSITAAQTSFQGNSATEGAGIYNTNASMPDSIGTVVLTNVTFNGNLGSAGAGVSNHSGTATLLNVTLQGNAARNGEGGGFDNVFGDATLTNVTLQGNTATTAGGGIYNNTASGTGTMQLKNVAIADSGTAGNCGGTTPDSASFSLSTDTTCTLSGPGNVTNTPALLEPLQNNGGEMLTMLPGPGSPLIDGGLCIMGANTDERGLPRPQGAACDIGAVEVQPNDLLYQIDLPLVMR